MDRILINNWNEVVQKDDVVFVVGDFSFKGAPARNYLSRLNGEVHLIQGNHDKFNRGDYASVDDIARVTQGNDTVFLCHYPVAEWDGFYHGSLHFYGHIHNGSPEVAKIMSGINGAYNVGADLLGFTPRTIEEIVSSKF